MAITYILYSESIDAYYIGSTTTSLEERQRKHLTNHSGYTARAKDWQYVWWKEFPTREAAVIEERRIKKMKSRKAIMSLIARREET